VDIDPTKYIINSSRLHRKSGPDCRAESSAHVNHASNIGSASFAALDSSHLHEQVSSRLQSIADSAPNISVSYDGHAHKKRSAHSRRRNSTHMEVGHSDRRGHAVRGPPISGRPVAVSDLNLTNSMTSLIQSGSTSSHAWPMLSTPDAVSVPAGARKPPSGNQRVRPTKRTTPRLQSDDHRPSTTCNTYVLRRPVSVDAVYRGDATPLKVPGASIEIKRSQLRSALSSVCSPHDFAEEHLSITPVIPSPPTQRPLQQSLSVTLTNGDQNRVRSGSFSPPFGGDPRSTGDLVTSPAPPLTSAMLRQRPEFQERRQRCVSHTDVRFVSSASPATDGISQYCQHNLAIRPQLCSQPRLGVKLINRNPTQIGRGKAVSLVDVTSGRRTSNSAESRSVFGTTGALWSPCDATNVAETQMGVAGSHESLSDEGYQTKDSGSTTSLNRASFNFRGRNHQLHAYL